jgi:hypothetical protein
MLAPQVRFQWLGADSSARTRLIAQDTTCLARLQGIVLDSPGKMLRALETAAFAS